MTDVLAYQDALGDSESHQRDRAVLLGNGFSMAWDASIFGYSSLYEEADLDALSVSKNELFAVLGTHDFERVVEAADTAALLADLYSSSDPDLADRLRADAEVVRHGLADVLAVRHPDNARSVQDDEYRHARNFLRSFDRVFSVNYDLLLYWAVNADIGPDDVVKADGFEWPSFHDRRTLIWKSRKAQQDQRVFFLHGAFHMFVESFEGTKRLHKLAYSSEPLIIQVRERIDSGCYPLVVTEGTSHQKRVRVERSAYLRFCRESLRGLEGDLFIFGMALSANDEHILELIADEHSEISSLYVSIRNDSNDADEVIDRARRIQRRRRDNGGRSLDVRFYEAASAHVWG